MLKKSHRLKPYEFWSPSSLASDPKHIKILEKSDGSFSVDGMKHKPTGMDKTREPPRTQKHTCIYLGKSLNVRKKFI